MQPQIHPYIENGYQICSDRKVRIGSPNLIDIVTHHLHSFMVVAPSLTEDLAFFVQLSCEIFAQICQPVLELLLERIEDIMHVPHGLHRLLLVLLNLTVSHHRHKAHR